MGQPRPSPRFRIPRAAFGVIKEILRHLLRRPVVGIAAVARTAEGHVVLIRRADTGTWALPGGTLEWGETLRNAITRELAEEAGVQVASLGELLGAYSAPERDARFHAVTLVVEALVSAPTEPPLNPLEVLEVRAFPVAELPTELAHGMGPMLENALRGRRAWE
jgi:8-oxo-dGTP diphosphatase